MKTIPVFPVAQDYKNLIKGHVWKQFVKSWLSALERWHRLLLCCTLWREMGKHLGSGTLRLHAAFKSPLLPASNALLPHPRHKHTEASCLSSDSIFDYSTVNKIFDHCIVSWNWRPRDRTAHRYVLFSLQCGLHSAPPSNYIYPLHFLTLKIQEMSIKKLVF